MNLLAGRLKNCKGPEAVYCVQYLLSVCKHSSALYGDKIPFEVHINWFSGLLRNQQNQTNREAGQVEAAFYIYVTQMSYSNHQGRMKEGRNISRFFLQEPPSIQPQALRMEIPKFREGRGEKLMKYLQLQEEDLLKKHDKPRKLGELIKKFRKEVANAFEENTDTASN